MLHLFTVINLHRQRSMSIKSARTTTMGWFPTVCNLVTDEWCLAYLPEARIQEFWCRSYNYCRLACHLMRFGRPWATPCKIVRSAKLMYLVQPILGPLHVSIYHSRRAVLMNAYGTSTAFFPTNFLIYCPLPGWGLIWRAANSKLQTEHLCRKLDGHDERRVLH